MHRLLLGTDDRAIRPRCYQHPIDALIAVFIAAEKLLPWRRAATTFVSVALLVLGLAVALVLERVPGLMTGDAAMYKMSMPFIPW